MFLYLSMGVVLAMAVTSLLVVAALIVWPGALLVAPTVVLALGKVEEAISIAAARAPRGRRGIFFFGGTELHVRQARVAHRGVALTVEVDRHGQCQVRATAVRADDDLGADAQGLPMGVHPNEPLDDIIETVWKWERPQLARRFAVLDTYHSGVGSHGNLISHSAVKGVLRLMHAHHTAMNEVYAGHVGV